MSTRAGARHSSVRWLKAASHLLAGLAAGFVLWVLCVVACWPFAWFAIALGSVLTLAIWTLASAIYAIRTRGRSRALDHLLFLAGSGVVPILYGSIMSFGLATL
ncbi:hypothetical protein [Nocardia puris]|uniref:Uncharacterized protein n=1 Tax=Nocardia puris TaxID=208602 RepID=A0A366DHK0_9NOCA|nr:hypothetical protein [Nocardia puris]RBO89560.1 hypothetical protein DFR74_107238 [Nocardia puris]